jgi:hypothetical protein
MSMFKSLSMPAALVLTASLVTPLAHAAPAGFESGDAQGWTVSADGVQLTAQGSYTVTLTDDQDPSFSYTTTVTPVSGGYFGLLQMGTMPATTATTPVSYSSQAEFTLALPSTAGDKLFLRLLAADYLYSDAGPGVPAYDDSIAVVYDGDTANPDVWRASDILDAGWSGDSGWQPFVLPVGTQHLQFTLTNHYSVDGNNAPLAALDFSVASVPEPSSFALMALGLGVLVRVRSRPRA